MEANLANHLRQNDGKLERVEFDTRYVDDYRYYDEIEYLIPGICEACKFNKTVKYVTIGEEFVLSFSKRVICSLLEGISHLQNLREIAFALGVGRNQRAVLPVRVITNLLKRAKHLERLTIQNLELCGNDDNSVDDLAKAFENHLSLKDVIIRNCGFQSDFRATKGGNFNPRDIVLPSRIVESLCGSRNFSSLQLEGVTLSDESFHLMLKGLKTNTCLRSLILTNCGMSNDAAMDIANILRVNSSIEFLCLDDSYVTDDGCAFIADALYCNKALKKLHISSSSIKEEGHMALANMLRHNYCLQDLKIGGASQSKIQLLLRARKEILRHLNNEHGISRDTVLRTLASSKGDLNRLYSLLSLHPSLLLAVSN